MVGGRDSVKKNGAVIFLGICILFAGGFIGSGLGNVADSIYGTQSTSNDTYRVFVQDGVIYKYDIISGQVWKKVDKPDSKWEQVDDSFSD